MGCDVNDIIRVVQFGAPPCILTLVQRLGRAARNPLIQGDGILLYSAHQALGNVADQRVLDFISTKGCRREVLNGIFANRPPPNGQCKKGQRKKGEGKKGHRKEGEGKKGHRKEGQRCIVQSSKCWVLKESSSSILQLWNVIRKTSPLEHKKSEHKKGQRKKDQHKKDQHKKDQHKKDQHKRGQRKKGQCYIVQNSNCRTSSLERKGEQKKGQRKKGQRKKGQHKKGECKKGRHKKGRCKKGQCCIVQNSNCRAPKEPSSSILQL
ncbi:hypothetical protein BGZ92_004441 [Podila epicladia]|nr:hypothetical protein BGZ92_004441 [Podila epicladia]